MTMKPRLVDDPNTFIPPAVRRMAEQADAAFRSASNQPAGAPGAAPVEAQIPPVEAPAPAPAPDNRLPDADVRHEHARTPEIAPQVTPQVTPTEDESWERRYKGMEGRYKRAENDIRAMSEQLASMQNLIGTMQRGSQETPAELRPQSLLTPEERNEYGDEFLGVVARRAKEELNPEVTMLRNQLTKLERQFQGTAEQNNARERHLMEAALDQRIPLWRDVNILPEFHSWLALPDTYSGAIRHELLRTAYAQNNTPRVLAFFKGFLDQEAAYVPQGGEPHQAAELQNGGKVPLESFAAPGRAKTSAAGQAPVEKPIITRAQISQFYADSASGKYRGREAEKNQLEAMIFEAERDGRLR